MASNQWGRVLATATAVLMASTIASCTTSTHGTTPSAAKHPSGTGTHAAVKPPTAAAINAVLSDAKRDLRAVYGMDCRHRSTWRNALAATTGIERTDLAGQVRTLAKYPATCTFDGVRSTVAQVALTSVKGSSAVVAVEGRDHFKGHPGRDDVGIQEVDLARVNGRWLIEVLDDSKPPLASDLSWASAKVRQAVREGVREVRLAFSQDLSSASTTVDRGRAVLTGAATTKFGVIVGALGHWMRSINAVKTVADVNAVGVEAPTDAADPKLLVDVVLVPWNHEGYASTESTDHLPSEVTMTKKGNAWFISEFVPGTP